MPTHRLPRHARLRSRVLPVAGPGLLTVLLATTTVGAAPAAAASAEAPLAAPPVVSAAAADQPLPPYRVVLGTRLKKKPPPPFELPVDGYHLTGRFGQSSGLWASTHTGLDFAAPEGTAIHSIAAGVVESVGYDGAFGNKTVVRLDDGTVLWYCHQSDTAVSAGERVAVGQVIGAVGSTGNTTGPHLHLEVHPGDGEAIDPEAWLPTHGLHP